MDDGVRRAAETALQQLCEDGSPVVRPETVGDTVAIGWRRWISFERRKPRDRGVDARVEDLAKGLRAAFESDPNLAGPLMEDYRHLARTLSMAFEAVT